MGEAGNNAHRMGRSELLAATLMKHLYGGWRVRVANRYDMEMEVRWGKASTHKHAGGWKEQHNMKHGETYQQSNKYMREAGGRAAIWKCNLSRAALPATLAKNTSR